MNRERVDAHSTLKGTYCAIIMTEWDRFQRFKAKDFQADMKTPNIIDGRRIHDPSEFGDLNYPAIGLGSTNP